MKKVEVKKPVAKNEAKKVEFKPVVTKKEAQKNLTASLVLCKECKKQFVSLTKLNRCFGLKSKGAETAKKAVTLLKVKLLAKGNASYVLKDDAKKIIDFVYANKAK